MKQPIGNFQSFIGVVILFVLFQGISYFFLIKEYNNDELNTANIISSSINILVIFLFIKKSNIFQKDQKKRSEEKREEKQKAKSNNFSELLVLTSFFSWFFAELLYGLNGYIPNSIVYPSSADIFYVLGYVFFIAYLHWINKIYKLESRVVISSIITISLFIFYFIYVSFNIFRIFETNDNILSLILSFLYPILDAYIAVIAILYYFKVKTISLAGEHISWIFVTACFVLFFIGDFIYGYNFMMKINDSFLKFFNLYYNIGYTLLGVSFLIRYGYCIFFQKIF